MNPANIYAQRFGQMSMQGGPARAIIPGQPSPWGAQPPQPIGPAAPIAAPIAQPQPVGPAQPIGAPTMQSTGIPNPYLPQQMQPQPMNYNAMAQRYLQQPGM
jgi:hypothetical protein